MKAYRRIPIIFLISGGLLFIICKSQPAYTEELPQAATESKAPEIAWRGASAKQDLDSVLASARTFDPQAHLFMVTCNSDGSAADEAGYRRIDGLVNPDAWHYWFRNPDKKEKDIFSARYNNNSGSYIASDNVMLFGNVRGFDKGDIAPLWNIDSDRALKIAWDKAASIRQQYFQTESADYELGYEYITNTRDAVFAWKIKFHYKQYKTPDGQNIAPKDLVVYVDPKGGEVINYGPARLEYP